MSRHPITERILSGEAPEPICAAVARGAVPVPADELLLLRVHLARHGSEDLARVCREAVASQPVEELVPALSHEQCAAEVLDFAARVRSDDLAVMETVLEHAATPDATVLAAAQGDNAAILERITVNQMRLLRLPELVEALNDNPALPPPAVNRLHDIRQELERRLRKEERRAQPLPEEVPEPQAPPPVPSAPAEAEPEGAAAAEETEQESPAETQDSVEEHGETLFRIMKMSIPDRMQLALKGNREERGILIRDKVKSVCLAVLKSPKLTEPEVESFAGLRNVVDDVIRKVAENREWTKNYAVMHALCKNPKSPVRPVLTMMSRLNNRDIRLLGANRNVSEVVRNNARRFYNARIAPKSGKK